MSFLVCVMREIAPFEGLVSGVRLVVSVARQSEANRHSREQGLMRYLLGVTLHGGPPRTRTGTPRGARFSYHFGFRRPRRVRGLDCPFTIAAVAALGAARPVSTPSRSLGLGSGLAAKPSPTLSGSAPGVSVGALNFSSESRASTISARGPAAHVACQFRAANARPAWRQSRYRELLPPRLPANLRVSGFPPGQRVFRVRVAPRRAAVRPLLWGGWHSRPPDIDRRGVDRVLDMHGIELLDHLDAGAAVLGDLIDVRPFHQSEADVGVAKAVRRPAV